MAIFVAALPQVDGKPGDTRRGDDTLAHRAIVYVAFICFFD